MFVLRSFGHVERLENDGTHKRVYVWGCASSHSLGSPRKMWTDTVKDCLRIIGLNMVYRKIDELEIPDIKN